MHTINAKNKNFKDMTNFGVHGLSRLGPPAFPITPTPLYVENCALWSIHPDILRGVMDQDAFNTETNERGEGYPQRIAYDNFKKDTKQFTHTTVFTPQTPTANKHLSIINMRKPYASVIETVNALNRIGLNYSTVIIILFGVFLCFTINAYHQNDNQQMRIRMSNEELLGRLNELNDTIVSINTETHSMKETLHTNQEKSVKLNDTIAHINDWFQYQQKTNWISGVINRPKAVAYGNKNQNNNNIVTMSIWDAFVTGIQVWHNGSIESSKTDNIYDSYRLNYTANVDITDFATSDTLQPNDCLQFEISKQNRWIEISLIEKIIVTEFEYIHISKNKISSKDRNKSPKRFMLFGKVRNGEWNDIPMKENKILPINESKLTLKLDMKTGIEFMRIEYDINDDAQSTRLYRMRVHGSPDIGQYIAQ